MSSAPAVISLESVSKRYGSVTVVHDLSFTVARGEIVGFLGPNGAGKTTTLRMIAGFITATSGRVSVDGCDMATRNVEASRRIGYLPERPPLYDALDVTTYLRFVAKVKGVRRAAMAAELERVCTACRLEAVAHHEIYKLSKGYRQRLGLAQALVGDPAVLLLDEPTAGLDPGQIHETREVIRAFGRDHAVLFSTHILAEATLICGRVAIIDRGRLVAIDSPAGLERAAERTNQVLLEATAPPAALRERLLAVDGVRDVEIETSARDGRVVAVCRVEGDDEVEAAIARAVAAGWDLHRLERRHATLENVFLRYVGRAAGHGETAA
jgi:ABC-2 type transport system ATP-binding protein